MRHGSLETGIGCFDYAAEKMRWENVFHVEINSFCQTILKYYWPNADSYADIFEFDGRPYRGLIDIITCGFPCQPFSLAGKGRGDKDDRFIWPENMRIIREIEPAYVVAENVPGLLSKHPMVFERVCADLEDEGYQVVPVNIPACAAEEDHERQRWFFIAYNHRYGHGNINGPEKDTSQAGTHKGNGNKRQRSGSESGRIYQNDTDNSYTASIRFPGPGQHRGSVNSETIRNRKANEFKHDHQLKESWLEAATRLCRVDDGTSGGLDPEAISKAKWYRESIRGYGNAVHWKIAYGIFKAIEQTRCHTNGKITPAPGAG